MKIQVPTTKTVEVTHILLRLPIDSDDDLPRDLPLRKDDTWCAYINVDTGKIDDWPDNRPYEMHLKVVDSGTYILIASDGLVAARIEDYVPHGVVPGRYGDYVELKIDEHGFVTNWPNKPDCSAFFKRDDE